MRNSKKSSTFALAFENCLWTDMFSISWKVVWVVERAALEMRCTHYVVPGVRIPHFPQTKHETCLSKFTWASRSFVLVARMPSADFRDYAEIPHFPQSVEFGKLNKMQKGMEVIDFHFFVGNSACWEFIIIKVLWFTKRKGAYTLSFVFCLVGRTEALHRMPLAGIRVFEVGGVAARCPRIPHFPLMTNQKEVI